MRNESINPDKNRQRGQSLVEYVALTALVAIVSIGTVKLFGSKVRTRLNQVTLTFERNVQQGLKARSNRGIVDTDNEDDESTAPQLPGGFKMPKGLPHF